MTSTEQRLNIPSTVKDPHYRYTMPKIQITTQGSGNGIKTNWVNLPDVSNALKVPLEYPIKFIARELGSNTETKNNSYLINGSHKVETMQEVLDKFIRKYVLCPKCHIPEIHGKIRIGKKNEIKCTCRSCGATSKLDSEHNFAAYIRSYPPPYEKDIEIEKAGKKIEKKGAERFPDMVKSINKFVELDPKLTKEERNLLSAGFKNIISDKRSSWRLLNNMERKEEKKNPSQSANIKEIKDKIEKELNSICSEVQSIIDKYLVPNAIDTENKVFYLKLKADYYRYKCEFASGKDFDEACANAEKVYKEAYELSNKELPINNSTRLGLDLNFSVFYYEIKALKEEACQIAKTAFDESMKVLDDLEKSKAKDTLLIIQLLKENLILWTNEMNEEEE